MTNFRRRRRRTLKKECKLGIETASSKITSEFKDDKKYGKKYKATE